MSRRKRRAFTPEFNPVGRGGRTLVGQSRRRSVDCADGAESPTSVLSSRDAASASFASGAWA